ncbi:Kinase protein with adenine nucleotide alpha hydrolases-like domain, putative isoform 2 [Hibiscus syriacus]|uniref:Kinase protein with adenine nucleotide alpha hydrolases-like domain, putative isoform 2 n=1 Tax=Hibiscus syriacus TaxID=106335 RepID=A0A6A2XJH4_HIBSY|nr:Kinase protein with adenine nucleotide alpha hydrolases-like domain, putative isoform 2 [Hibiscus syriacus]
MVSQTDSNARESVIVVMDAKRNKGMVDALDWALKHCVRRRDTVIVIGVLGEMGKKNATHCFPLNMGINISGILEKLEFSSGHTELKPRDVEEELERKREQYQAILQPFTRKCKRNEVKLEVTLAARICPIEITLKEAQNPNTRWIVLDSAVMFLILDSHLKKYKMCIYWNVECNVAVMKGKDVATLMPSRAPKPEHSPVSSERADAETWPDDQPLNDPEHVNPNAVEEGESPILQTPRGPSWYPLQYRAGFPREFSFDEIKEITNGFSDTICEEGNLKIYEGVLENTPVIVKSIQEDERFWSMLTILSRVRHRNIMNIVGYCCSGTNGLLISDYPCLYNFAMKLQCDISAINLTWRARWYTAIEIGGSLRYLHEECPDGPIVHQSVCSSNIVYSHGYSPMLSNFITAKWHKEEVQCNGNSSGKCPNLEEDKRVYVDVHDYGLFLVELISGKVAGCFPHENEGQSLKDWGFSFGRSVSVSGFNRILSSVPHVGCREHLELSGCKKCSQRAALPLLESDLITHLVDPRLADKDDDSKVVHCMARAALLCLKNDSGRSISISEVLAVVRGDQRAILQF